MDRLFGRKSAHLETELTAFSVLWVIYHHNEDPFACNVHTLDPVYQAEIRTIADISIQHADTDNIPCLSVVGKRDIGSSL